MLFSAALNRTAWVCACVVDDFRSLNCRKWRIEIANPIPASARNRPRATV